MYTLVPYLACKLPGSGGQLGVYIMVYRDVGVVRDIGMYMVANIL
jgi:hypothetical protein